MFQGDTARRFRLLCCIHRTGFVCIWNDGRKTDGCHCDGTWLCRTSSRRSISLHSSEHERRSKIAQHSKVRMSRRVDASSKTLVAQNHWKTLKIRWFFLSEICVVIHWPDWYGRDNSRKFCWNLDGKESTELGEYVCLSKTRVIFVSVCGSHQKDWKEAEYGSHVEESDEKCRHWRTNISSWPWKFGMHSTWLQTWWNN